MRILIIMSVLSLVFSCSSNSVSNKGELSFHLKIKDPLKKEEVIDILKRRIDYFAQKAQFVDAETEGSFKVVVPNENDTSLFLSLLTTKGQIKFVETFENAEFFKFLGDINDAIKLEEIDGFLEPDSARLAGLDSLNLPRFSLFNRLTPNVDLNNALRKGPHVGICATKDTQLITSLFKRNFVREIIKEQALISWAKGPLEGYHYLVVLKPSVQNAIGNSEISSVAAQKSDFMEGKYQLQLTLNASGAQKLATLTKRNIGKSIAIVIDNIVFSAPIVQTEITNGSVLISGDANERETKQLAAILGSTSLPTIVEAIGL